VKQVDHWGGIVVPEGNSTSRTVARNRVLPVLLFTVAVLLPGRSSAECIDPTYCYCGLVPDGDGAVLVRAEVMRESDSGVDIRVLGIPFYDPGGLVASGEALEDFTGCDRTNITVGDVGIFLAYPEAGAIRFFIIEEGGRYFCEYKPDFPGLDMNELAQLVLSGDCWENAHALGIVADCDPIVSGCCNNEVIMRHQPAALLVALIAIRSRKKRGSPGTEA